ncbi:MAG: hypothetical protein NT030_08560, partial [Candidatus Saganbacteria bacterium]|nr:hypothetical protein [Candidatus Saganbacteria bacterium]
KDKVTGDEKMAITMGLVKLLDKELKGDIGLLQEVMTYRRAVAECVESKEIEIEFDTNLYRAEKDLYSAMMTARGDTEFSRKTEREKENDFRAMYRFGYISAIADELHLDKNFIRLPKDKVIPVNKVSVIMSLRGLVSGLVDKNVVAVAKKGPDFELEKIWYRNKKREEVRNKAKELEITLSDAVVQKYLSEAGEDFYVLYRRGVVNSRVKSLYDAGKEDEASVEKILYAEKFADMLGKGWRALSAGEVGNWTKIFLERVYLTDEERKGMEKTKDSLLNERLKIKDDLGDWRKPLWMEGATGTGRVSEVYQDMGKIFGLIDFEQRNQIKAVDTIKKWLKQQRGIEEDEVFDRLFDVYGKTGLRDYQIGAIKAYMYNPKMISWRIIGKKAEGTRKNKR